MFYYVRQLLRNFARLLLGARQELVGNEIDECGESILASFSREELQS